MTNPIDMTELLVPEQHRELVFRFLLVFSRFEYALKRAKYTNGSAKHVDPAWDSFSSRYGSDFDPSQTKELRAACDYFKETPPRKQILDAGVLAWSEPQFQTTEPQFTWLILMVRSVRNNLFHGGKFPFVPIEDPARNYDILRHSLTILDACVALDPDVSHHFFTNET